MWNIQCFKILERRDECSECVEGRICQVVRAEIKSYDVWEVLLELCEEPGEEVIADLTSNE